MSSMEQTPALSKIPLPFLADTSVAQRAPGIRTNVRNNESRLVYAFAAFAIWGLFLIYFKALHSISAIEMLAHRMAWSMAFLLVVLTVLRKWQWLLPTLRDRAACSHVSPRARCCCPPTGASISGR